MTRVPVREHTRSMMLNPAPLRRDTARKPRFYSPSELIRLLKIPKGHIAVFHTYGMSIVPKTEYQQFIEDQSVSHGEEGAPFDISLVVDPAGFMLTGDRAYGYYSV